MRSTKSLRLIRLSVLAPGALTLQGHIDSGGHCPRVLATSPDDKWMLIGNGGIEKPMYTPTSQHIRNVQTRRISADTGLPSATAASMWTMGWDSVGSPGGVVAFNRPRAA
eukprot:m.486972 g.486972  ORF g.486972 m.486972 type:complete len:110 (+) comp21747_c1_seq6:422-751(+)